MEELNINDLPTEILTEIFRYLNVGNSKCATMVCKLWNNLIESEFRWSLDLEYDERSDDSMQKTDLVLTTNRKFETIKIGGIRLNEDEQILQLFKRHGFNVVELHLYGCRIDNLTEFAELLTFTPNLKHVVVSIKSSPGSSDVLLRKRLLPDLKQFKSLVIQGGDHRIIKCFRNAKLTSIESWETLPSHNRSQLLEFLSTQDELTSLTIKSDSSSILIEMGKLNVPIPFRLRQLSISGITCQTTPQEHYLMSFIESQAGNLTEIEMNYRIPMSVYECVFASMTKLTILSVVLDELPKDNDFYDRLKENFNVHTVRLLDSGRKFDVQFLGKFLRKLPNVRCLISRNTERPLNENIFIMAQSLNKLESLYIGLYNAASLDCVKFPNLKTLHIHRLGGKINWNECTKAHPLLTELTIETMDKESYLTSDDIDQITSNVDLQNIRLGTGFVADNRFFEIVGSKCTNLKVLDLHKSCISQNLGHYLKIDVLRLRDSIKCAEVFLSRLFG